jgi:hypothetical protein
VSREEPERLNTASCRRRFFRQIRERFMAAAAAQRLQIVPLTE